MGPWMSTIGPWRWVFGSSGQAQCDTSVHSDISEIIPEGLIDETGTIHKCDIPVCATGFNIGFAPSFLVRGVDGITWRMNPTQNQ
jgi:hypothetical protein